MTNSQTSSQTITLKSKATKRMVMHIAIALVIVIGYLLVSSKVTDDAGSGFILGFSIGLLGLDLILLTKLVIAMRNETALKQLFIKEADERGILIREKTSRYSMVVYSVVLGIACVVSFFVNDVVFLTLFCVMIGMAFVKLVLKAYFTRNL